MQSSAKTVAAYVSEQPPERRQVLEALRRLLKDNFDPRIEESMSYGHVGYCVPLEIYPPGYHCKPDQPLPVACLASQKQHLSLYFMGLYSHPKSAENFVKAWKATGKKLDMGKSCIRFKRLEDLALDVIADYLRAFKLDEYVLQYEAQYGPATKPRPKGQSKAAVAAGGSKRAASTTPSARASKAKGSAAKPASKAAPKPAAQLAKLPAAAKTGRAQSKREPSRSKPAKGARSVQARGKPGASA